MLDHMWHYRSLCICVVPFLHCVKHQGMLAYTVSVMQANTIDSRYIFNLLSPFNSHTNSR